MGRPPSPNRVALAALLALVSGCGAGGPIPHAGFVDARTSAVVSQVAGKVERIAVQEGERVRAGQVIAQLDSRERSAAVAQAEAAVNERTEALHQAEAELRATVPTVKGAGADIRRIHATLEEAQRNFQRTQQLARGNAATPQELDAARARLREAQAQLGSLAANRDVASGRARAALAAVGSARAAVESSEAALQLARVQLQQATLVAPFEGVVVNRNVEEGEWVAPGTPVITLEDASRPWVRLDLEETQLRGLRLGAPVSVSVIALPGKTFSAHVIEVGAQAEFAVNRDVKRGRPDLRTFRVRAAFDAPDPALRPGMTAEVRPTPSPSAAPAKAERHAGVPEVPR